MKWLKIVLPVFAGTLIYCVMSVCFGPRGIWAMEQLSQEKDRLEQHLDYLYTINTDLDIKFRNLTADLDTISVYAHELGYVAEDEYLIKLAGFSGGIDRKVYAGEPIITAKPEYVPEWICKLFGIISGLLVFFICITVNLKKSTKNMIILKNSSDSAETAAAFLKAGKLVILPADTMYGFSGTVPGSEQLIIAAKGRDEGKPFIQLLAHPEDIFHYTDNIIPAGLLNMWPAALTLIIRNKTGGTTAFRCPDCAWLREVIEKTGTPIYSTSVNRSGESPLHAIGEIIAEFSDVADLIVDDGDYRFPAASTIVDITGEKYRILRQGDVTVPGEYLE
ncbi:Sua5/YciO/YrdC/YwlC family protein [Brucepastera parasyntrophica]|uniref:Sua5/YciO/YrdC/YwlC family protein n=1 Tax=Brucepastera parasyntrophica TaxID=2880008 RepID=UPI00210C42DE|nr:Sua5/YciO/YrdC/YwlC family protein [Brucepastera parasyntrophica]ULQ60005.1 Sua5/YciO/YrdC/YwlC family protein [Brucepastera parasyntrophica]